MVDNKRCHGEELGKHRADMNDHFQLGTTPTASSAQIATAERCEANLREMRKRPRVVRPPWNCPSQRQLLERNATSTLVHARTRRLSLPDSSLHRFGSI